MNETTLGLLALAGLAGAIGILVAAGLPHRVEFHWSCPWIWLPPWWLRRRRWFARLVPRRVSRGWHLKFWILFGSSVGEYWGAGLVQFGRRHLFAVIKNDDNPRAVIWLGFVRVR